MLTNQELSDLRTVQIIHTTYLGLNLFAAYASYEAASQYLFSLFSFFSFILVIRHTYFLMIEDLPKKPSRSILILAQTHLLSQCILLFYAGKIFGGTVKVIYVFVATVTALLVIGAFAQSAERHPPTS